MVLQNVGHHLVGAGRLEELKQLLASPGWLERKLHSYGTASAVADFRRCHSTLVWPFTCLECIVGVIHPAIAITPGIGSLCANDWRIKEMSESFHFITDFLRSTHHCISEKTLLALVKCCACQVSDGVWG